MASNACITTFAVAEEVQMTHSYRLKTLTLATEIMISSLLVKADKMDVVKVLKDTLASSKWF